MKEWKEKHKDFSRSWHWQGKQHSQSNPQRNITINEMRKKIVRKIHFESDKKSQS